MADGNSRFDQRFPVAPNAESSMVQPIDQHNTTIVCINASMGDALPIRADSHSVHRHLTIILKEF